MAPASRRRFCNVSEELVNRKIRTAITIAAAILALSVVSFSLMAHRVSAQTPELHVMISDGMKTVVEELTPQIEHSIGRKLAAQFNSSKNLQEKITAGGHAEISRTGMGIGVRAGAPKPDISTPEALKRTLLNAKSISFNPTGASAAHTYDMFARLGITEAVQPKLILDAEAGRPQMNVAAGKVELVISLIPEIKFFPGVDLVGPVPPDFQSYINFAAGIATNPRDADAAKALIQFIAGPAVVPVL